MESNEILLLQTAATILSGMLANPEIEFEPGMAQWVSGGYPAERLAVQTAKRLMASVKAAIAETQPNSGEFGSSI